MMKKMSSKIKTHARKVLVRYPTLLWTPTVIDNELNSGVWLFVLGNSHDILEYEYESSYTRLTIVSTYTDGDGSSFYLFENL